MKQDGIRQYYTNMSFHRSNNNKNNNNTSELVNVRAEMRSTAFFRAHRLFLML